MTNGRLSILLEGILAAAGWKLSLQAIAAVLDARDELLAKTDALAQHMGADEPSADQLRDSLLNIVDIVESEYGWKKHSENEEHREDWAKLEAALTWIRSRAQVNRRENP